MPDAEEVPGSVRVSLIEKRPIRFRYRSVLRRSPNVRAKLSEKYCLFLLDLLQTDTLGSSMMKTLFSVFSVLVAASVMAADLQPPKSVEVKPASNEGTIAMKGFELAPGLKLSLVAAEPLLANPVAFDIDEQGRFMWWKVSACTRA